MLHTKSVFSWNPENRLIKSTLLTLLKQTSCGDTAKNIRRLLTAFELVEPSVCYERDFSKVSIDRNTGEYEVLMKWAKVFLQHSSFTEGISAAQQFHKLFRFRICSVTALSDGKSVRILCCRAFEKNLRRKKYENFGTGQMLLSV